MDRDVAGVLRELWTLGVTPPGGDLRIAVASDVPIGAGLSSSAALSVSAARAIATFTGATLMPARSPASHFAQSMITSVCIAA
jgi:galactokinase